jgi:S1-C subfamily serine protease
MGIRVECAQCGSSLRVRNEYAGKRGACPKCGAILRIPAAATDSVSASAAPPTPHAVAGPRPPANVVPPPVQLPPNFDHGGPAARSLVHTTAVDIDAPPTLTRKPRPARFGPMAFFAAGALTVAVLACGAFVLVRQVADAPVPEPKLASAAPVELDINPKPFAGLLEHEEANPGKPAASASLEDVVEYVKNGIVKIETSDRWNHRRGLGSGFVVDPRGFIATTYHVVSDADKAEALFWDGTRASVEGYAAVDAHSDLAILKLDCLPKNASVLEVKYADGPRDASKVYAIGHPYDNEFTTTEGIVGRVLRTTQLPADTRGWLRSTLSESDDDLWIQHDAKISPGNSGGPLINARGEVIGINSWVNQKLGMGYAIHAQHLHELMERQFADIVPLRMRRRNLPEPAQPQFGDLHVGSEHIKNLWDELSAKDWRPASTDDCATFDELARTITAVRYIQSHPGSEGPMPQDEQQAMILAADEVVGALRAVHWKERDQILPINAHGGRERQPYGGAFLFGLVSKIFQAGNDVGLLLEVRGSDQRFFLPLDEAIPGLKEGDCVLVLGIAHPSTIELGNGPHSANRVQVLLSKVVLPVAM